METTFKYNLVKILQEVNGERDLVPYWIKLDLLDRNVPISIDPTNIKNKLFEVSFGNISYYDEDGFMVIKWTVDKN